MTKGPKEEKFEISLPSHIYGEGFSIKLGDRDLTPILPVSKIEVKLGNYKECPLTQVVLTCDVDSINISVLSSEVTIVNRDREDGEAVRD